MRLIGLKIQNFRSVQQLSLNNLGNFNVFIGKNNAGKSTVINAINHFFSMMDISLVTEVFSKDDFRNKKLDKPIAVSGSLIFNPNELNHENEFFNTMTEEYPQLIAAVENLKKLKVINLYTKGFYNSDFGGTFSYIERITLSDKCPFDSEEIEETILFSIDENGINEFVEKALKKKELSINIKQMNSALERFEASDYKRASDRGTVPRFGRYKDVFDRLNDLLEKSNDYQDFRKLALEDVENFEKKLLEVENSSLQNEFTLFSGVSKQVPKHIQKLLGIIKEIVILRELHRKEEIDQDDAEQLLRLKNKRGKGEKYTKLQKTVEDLLGATIGAYTSDEEDDTAEIDIDDFLVDLNGTGIKESLRLLLDIEFTNPQVILLEEPEVYLHFGLERKLFFHLVKYSLENGIQIFTTTHSTGFIDRSDTSNIFLIKKENKNTSAISLVNNEITEVLNELGVDLSAVVFAKFLFFVEGPTDEYVIRSYITQYYPNVSYSDVGFVQMSGVGNYKYYANANTLELFSKYGLKSLFIIDKDSKGIDEIKRLVDNHPKFSKLEVLPVRSMESLFLVPEIITKFITQKLVQSGSKNAPPEVDDVKNLLERYIEEYKNETFRLGLGWKYLRSIHLNKLVEQNDVKTLEESTAVVKEGLEALVKMSKELLLDYTNAIENDVAEFESVWEKNKLSIVPGDKVIDAICKNFGMRYKKKQSDAELLTNSISQEMWPSYIQNLIDDSLRRFII